MPRPQKHHLIGFAALAVAGVVSVQAILTQPLSAAAREQVAQAVGAVDKANAVVDDITASIVDIGQAVGNGDRAAAVVAAETGRAAAVRLGAITDELQSAVRDLPSLHGSGGKKLSKQLNASPQTLRDLSAAAIVAFNEYARAYASSDGKPSVDVGSFSTLLQQTADEHGGITALWEQIKK